MSNLLPRLAKLEAKSQAQTISFNNTPYFRASDYIRGTNRTPERTGALTDKTNNLVPISIITGTRDIGGVL